MRISLRFPAEIAKDTAVRGKMLRKHRKMTQAYDLTYSSSIGGEHATCINDNGKQPELCDVIAVGRNAGLSPNKLERRQKKFSLLLKNLWAGHCVVTRNRRKQRGWHLPSSLKS